MSESNQQVWQIACGKEGRRYEDLFRDHDVVLLGPGEFGAFSNDVYDSDEVRRYYSGNRIGQVRSFADSVQPNNIVLLRSGYRVLSIGLVAQDQSYQHNESFDDVYGWDLSHLRRVVWQSQLEPELESLQSDNGDLFQDRKNIPSFTEVHDKKILEPIQHLFSKCTHRPLKMLPIDLPPPLSLEEFGDALFAKGLSYESVNRVIATLRKQRRLLDWYYLKELGEDGDHVEVAPNRPTEHEIVAHVILPLMSAIGWSEQLLAVEWNKVDLAVFWGTPTDRKKCKLVCEAKRMGHGMQNVLKQAVGYTAKLELEKCDKILLADGGRFYLHRRIDGEWETTPSGYMNVQKLRTRHLCPAGTNSVDMLISLTPSRVASY